MDGCKKVYQGLVRAITNSIHFYAQVQKNKKKKTIHFLAHYLSQLLGRQKEKVNFEKNEKNTNLML